MLRTRPSPAPGSGIAVSSSLKLASVGMSGGRAASTIWRFTVMVTDVSSDDGGHAAVEVDGSAGDVRGPLGHEEGHEVRELTRLGDAPDGHALGQLPVE